MFRVSFLVGAFGPKYPREMSNQVLEYLLTALYSIDCAWLGTPMGREAPGLYQSGVRYAREPAGREDWQDIPTTLERGFGDCEDLACFRAAELTVRERRPSRPVYKWSTCKRTGAALYHIVVLRDDGMIEDPSRALGMGQGRE